MKTKDAQVLSLICALAAIYLDRTSITIDEVDRIYESGLEPQLNSAIDYIIEK